VVVLHPLLVAFLMSRAGSAFDALTADDRLALLVTLGFDGPQRYQGWEPQDLQYGCLFYEVQDELDRCYVKGQWSATPRREPPIKNAPKKRAKRTPRRKEVA
jgi:hypothetical protein